jgi:hypothetical protein
VVIDALIRAGETFIYGMLGILPSADGFLFTLPDGFLILPTVVSAFGLLGWLDYLLPINEALRVGATLFIVMNAWGILWIVGWIYQRIPGKLT